MNSEFAPTLIAWQRQHGRHQLPWQGSHDAYAIWVSEIMLQQTQVATALPRYGAFLQRFPNVQTLAQSTVDEVLALWSGLGYYSRARNMWRCAQAVVQNHQGLFPSQAKTLLALPGIGPSTAAAIAAFSAGECVSIFDGNVQRVLARCLGFEQDLASSAALQALNQHAQALISGLREPSDIRSYTQGLMDLGATVCTPKRPQCDACPFGGTCKAKASDSVGRLPLKTKKLKRKSQQWMLLALVSGSQNSPQLLMTQRPTPGVWAGLWSFPQFEDMAALHAFLRERGLAHVKFDALERFKHVLTHLDLWLTPVLVHLPEGECVELRLGERWVGADSAAQWGMPKPAAQLLKRLTSGSAQSRQLPLLDAA